MPAARRSVSDGRRAAACPARHARDRTVEALVFDVAGSPAEFSADLLIRLAGSAAVADLGLEARAPRDRLPARLRRPGTVQAHRSQRLGRQPGGRIHTSLRDRAGCAHPPGTRCARHAAGRSRSFAGIVRVDRFLSSAGQLRRAVDPGRRRVLLRPQHDREAHVSAWGRRPRSGAQVSRGQSLARPAAVGTARRGAGGAGVPAPGGEAGYLEVSISALLERRERDARGFATFGLDITTRTGELADFDRSAGVGGETLMRALRKYLVGELSGSRCSDSAAEIPIVDAFNAMVRRRDVPADVATPIAANETRPARILGAAPADRYWETVEARRLVDGLVHLREPLKKPAAPPSSRPRPGRRRRSNGFRSWNCGTAAVNRSGATTSTRRACCLGASWTSPRHPPCRPAPSGRSSSSCAAATRIAIGARCGSPMCAFCSIGAIPQFSPPSINRAISCWSCTRAPSAS